MARPAGVALAHLSFRFRWFGTDAVEFAIGSEGPLPNGAGPLPPHNYTSFSSVVKEVSFAR